MLKKANKSLSENPCSRKDTKQCSVCKSCSTKTVLYVCESGHVICSHCQTDDDAKISKQDRGDFSSKIQTNCKRNEVVHTLKKHKSELIYRNPKDLASGDCDKIVSITKSKDKSKSEHKIKCTGNINNGNKDLVQDNNSNNVETIVDYKNVNFKDNRSSDSNTSAQSSKRDLAEKNRGSDENVALEACPRPLVCPMLSCGKTIAMNSTMLHFYYDHPKVPRLLITKKTPRETVLKVSDISVKTQCLNIFLLQGINCCKKINRNDSSTKILRDNDFTPLLLMSAKMLTKQFRSEFNKKHYTKNKVVEDTADTKSNILKENEMILLCICKLEEPSIRCSITLRSKDKTHGYSYVGESVHIRKDLDSLAIFQSAECLVVHGPAINRILADGNLSVIVNILD